MVPGLTGLPNAFPYHHTHNMYTLITVLQRKNNTLLYWRLLNPQDNKTLSLAVTSKLQHYCMSLTDTILQGNLLLSSASCVMRTPLLVQWLSVILLKHWLVFQPSMNRYCNSVCVACVSVWTLHNLYPYNLKDFVRQDGLRYCSEC